MNPRAFNKVTVSKPGTQSLMASEDAQPTLRVSKQPCRHKWRHSSRQKKTKRLMLSPLSHGLRFLNTTVPLHRFDAQLPFSCDDRSVWEIVQSCLATISLCTWVAAHPNMTGPNAGIRAGLWERLLITLEALLTPELIIAWAMQQWLVAWKSTRDINGACGLRADRHIIALVTHHADRIA